MIDSVGYGARTACVALLAAALAACSRTGSQTGAAAADDDSGPAAAATSRTPDAVRDAGNAGVSAAATPPAAKLVKGHRIQRAEREGEGEGEGEGDYYPAPARQPGPDFVKDMEVPYTNLGATESRYFSGKFVDGDVMAKSLRKRDFDSLVLDLQSEGASDAIARTQAYGAAIQKSLQPFADRVQLGRFGCGRLLCMGSIGTLKPDWVSTWSAAIHDQPLPMPSLSINAIKVAPDRYEVRFAFTTSGHGGFRTKAR